jgi:hypothetical protein
MKTTGWVVGCLLVLSLAACGETERGSSSAQELGPSAVLGPTTTITSPPPPSSSTPPSPSGSGTATLESLSISPTMIQQQGQATAVVTLTAATESTANVVLATSNKDVAKVPGEVTVEARTSTASFRIDTASVAANTTVTITARYGGVARAATLTVMAGPPPENRPGPAPPSPSTPTPKPTPTPSPTPSPTPTPTPRPTPIPTPTPIPCLACDVIGTIDGPILIGR